MSDTHKTKPYHVQIAQRNGKKIRRDFRERYNWRNWYKTFPEMTFDERQAMLDAEIGQEPHRGDFYKMFDRSFVASEARRLNRKNRRQAKESLKRGGDDIDNYNVQNRNSAIWNSY